MLSYLLDMNINEQGTGRPVLVLHGGGGPGTVAGLVAHLAKTHRVLAATLPGWNGTPRPGELSSGPRMPTCMRDTSWSAT